MVVVTIEFWVCSFPLNSFAFISSFKFYGYGVMLVYEDFNTKFSGFILHIFLSVFVYFHSG